MYNFYDGGGCGASVGCAPIGVLEGVISGASVTGGNGVSIGGNGVLIGGPGVTVDGDCRER